MNTGTTIGLVLTTVGLLGGGYAWDYQQRNTDHFALSTQMVAGDVELDLQRTNLELKLLRVIEERRPLNADEIDRKQYLLELRQVLLEKQRSG